MDTFLPNQVKNYTNGKSAKTVVQVTYTKHSSDEANRKLRRKDGKKPRCSIECGSDLVHLKVIIEIAVMVVEKT